MSNFRTKLGLAALATAFAGLSYGQTVTLTQGIAASADLTLRSESETELVGDTTTYVTAINSGAIAGVTVYATLSLPVTGKAVSFAAPATANSDIVLTVGGVTYYGTVGTSSGTITFSGVTLPASPGGTLDAITIQNVRVNAVGAGNPSVTESILIQYPNPAATSGSSNVTGGGAVAVGYILQSLSYAVQSSNPPTPVSSSFTVCAGGTSLFNFGTTPASLNSTASFVVKVNELTAGAFRTQAQENGSFVSGNIGASTQATQITLTVANLPTLSTGSVTVYLPLSVSDAGGTTLTLVGSPATVTSPASLPYVAFPSVNGTVTATYFVSSGTPTTGNFLVPVYVNFAANTASVQSAITINAAYTPTAAITGPATLIPTFATSTLAATNVESISACSTTLLFPYVTNALGFETGIAIANTTTDNLKASATVTAGVSQSTPTPGSCILNFYGNATQPPAVNTGTIGAYSASPAQAPVFANILTTMIGSSGFSGYAIASCNFQEAHGFAFITDTSGTFSGTEGYLAVVVPNGRGESTGNTGN